jgi:hypothetical protein
MKRPARLNARGKAFWDHVTAGFVLSEVECQLLVEACRTLDTVESLEGASRDAESNSERLQALREVRQQRLTLGRLLGQLALPDEHGESLPTATSRRASKAARARWYTHSGNPGGLREVREGGA